jgi:exodeoxyribonuclease VII large subunit
MNNEAISVSELHSLVNQTLSFAYPEVLVEGEVSSFKVNQNKWVFFDLKDDKNVINCFIPIFHLNTAIEDGMLVRVKAAPQLTKWGKFSLNVREVELAGHGSLKRAFEMMKAQFEKEGLFDPSRKRIPAEFPERIALITSKQAAAYNDFVTVLAERFGGINIDHYQVQVQGSSAASQVVGAIERCNNGAQSYDAIVIVRGGGSMEDLQAFNSEDVVRAIYASSIPTVVGIGHEDDVSLAELAADIRAATPTDAARRIVPDRKEIKEQIDRRLAGMQTAMVTITSKDRALLSRFSHILENRINLMQFELAELQARINHAMVSISDSAKNNLNNLKKLLRSLDPSSILARGYSIARAEGHILKDAELYDYQSAVVLQLHRGQLELLPSQKEKGSSHD